MKRINHILITAMVLVAVVMFANANIPPAPVGMNNDTGNYWINYTGYKELDGPVNDNVSMNGAWCNGTATLLNKSVGPGGRANIIVGAYNRTGNGNMLVDYVSDNVQAPSAATELTCTCGDICVNEAGWWRDGGVLNTSGMPIQAAVDNATAGEMIYVWNGSYTENVDIGTSQLTLAGEGADVVNVSADSSSDHVFEVSADYVNISGFNVTGATGTGLQWKAGIYLGSVDHCDISDNTASDNRYGIWLDYSSNNTLTGNTASDNSHRGIRLSSSSNNRIYNNYFNNTNNALDNGNNIWNTTPAEGTNIIGEPWLGGNYWSDYAGADTNGDGLGDTLTPYSSGIGILTGGDYHPLVTPGFAAPNIASFAPESPVNDIYGDWTKFNVSVDQTVNVTWHLNETPQTPVNESVTEANYTFHAESVCVGEHNVSAVATNANGTAMQTWVWNVAATAPQTYNCTCGDICVNETGWWRDGGVLNTSGMPIQAAVTDATADEMIYVWNGSYTENVDIGTSQLTLAGEGADVVNVSADSSSDHVFEVSADYVNISGFNVTGATGISRAGIYLNGPDHCNISDNNASDNRYGIWLSSSSNNTLTGNTASNNSQRGIRLSSSSNNRIYNNYFNNTNNALDNGNNIWNTTPAEGTNIIGEPWLGGNYWSDYAGADTNGDGLGDTLTPYSSGIGILTGGDYHPLVTPGFAAPNIASFAPESPVNDIYGDWTKFNVSVDQTVNVTWHLNETPQTPVNESVTEANYTFHAESVCVGEHNVSAVATNANGTAMQTWVWNVAATAPQTYNCTCGDICVNETGWWRDGGVLNTSGMPIQAAVTDATADEMIYVWNGSYTENVDIGTSQLTLAGEGADVVNVSADSSSDHVFEVSADYVNISGFNVTGATGISRAGIYLNGPDHCNISDNNASDNRYGIWLSSSSNNTLTGNTASNNSQRGIRLSSSSNNRIYNNYFNNTNNALDNGNNIWNTTPAEGTNIIGEPWLGGNYWSDYAGADTNGDGLGDTLTPYSSGIGILTGGDYHPLVTPGFAAPNIASFAPESPVNDIYGDWTKFNVSVDQTVNVTWHLNETPQTPVNESVTEANYTFHAESVCVGEHNVSAVATNANGTAMQTWVWNVAATAPQTYNCTCGDICVNETGWWRDGGVLNTSGMPIQAAVTDATADEMIYVWNGSYTENVDIGTSQLTLAGEGADVVNVSADSSSDHVFEVSADYVNISGFNVTGATGISRAGIYLNGPDHCNISDNNASDNRYGIWLSSSSNNTLTGNTASNNSQRGIRLSSSSNNRIYNNYFNNTNNALDNGNNIWNTTPAEGTNIIGEPWLGGNYWSDYAGADTNGDGLGDTLTPYSSGIGILTGGDYHPLVTPGFAAPNIASFAPESPVNDIYGDWTKFNVSVDQTVNVTWHLNETPQTPVNESVTEANYTFHAESVCVGEHNVSAVATNANGTAMQTWVWNVAATAPQTYNCTCGDICVNETGWWRDGGVLNTSGMPIQAAVTDATADEMIYVWNGSYTENVDIGTSQLTLAGEGADVVNVSADSSSDHVFEVSADYVNISGFNVTGATGISRAGIYLNGPDHCNISDNNASDNRYGIWLSSSSNNTLTGNTASNNSQRGIRLSSSSNNRIYNNYFNNTNNALDNGNNIWNTTPAEGTNIIGEPWLGGNYWSDYAGADTNGDGLGDTLTPYSSGIGILTGGDYHPLVTPGFAAPNIASFAPESPVNDIYGDWTKFNVSVDQTVNVTWHLNETPQTPVNESVTEANYTFHAESVCVGEHNVSAVATNANGTAMQTWVWNVAATAPQTYNCTCGDICVNETGWWRDGGVLNTSGMPIQAAVTDATADEMIYVWNGSYTENVDIGTSQLTLAGEGADVVNVSADSSSDHVFEVSADYVNISGFNVTGATGISRAGIYLNGPDHCNISDNNASDNRYGIWLSSSSNNTLTGNTASNNSQRGIRLSSSSNNRIYNNYFNNTNNALDNGNNIWNTTPAEGTNIIGEPWLGGNYWSDYAGADTNGDGLGDTLTPYSSGIGILTGGDYHPLVTPGFAAPNIASFAPESPVNDIYGDWTKFNVSVDQTVNVTWHLNETPQTPVNESVTEANYTFHAESVCVGEHNVSAVATNANGTAMQTWVWNVAATAPQTYNCTCGDICVNETGWWRDGGVLNTSGMPIQAAVTDATADEMIYVWNGSYTENVDIGTSQLTLAGEGADVVNVSADSSSDHVFEVSADYVNISGFNVTGATGLIGGNAGIYLGSGVDHCNISDNTASDNRYGIRLSSSSNNTLTGNTASDNIQRGIWLDYSSNNTLTSNTASNNLAGIRLSSSSNNTLTSNNASDNSQRGIFLSSSSNNTLTGNNASDNLWDIYIEDSSSIFEDNTLNGTTVSFTYGGDVLLKGVGSPEDPPSGQNTIGKFINATNQSAGAWLYLNFSYSDSDVSGLDESSLKVWKYNGTDWLADGWNGTRYPDEGNNMVGVNITTFSVFAPMAPTAAAAPNITSYAPDTPVSSDEGVARSFNVTVNQTVNATWYINGSIVQQNTTASTGVSYTNASAVAGYWNVSVVVNNTKGTDMQTWLWTVNAAPAGAPNITSHAPTSPVSNTAGATRAFNIIVNQTVDVTWYINGTSVQTNTSTTIATYTNTSAAVGVWNISAAVTNANGDDMETWTWTVTAGPVTRIVVAPTSASLNLSEYQEFTATAKDQYGNNKSVTFTWGTVPSGVGTLNDMTGSVVNFTAAHVGRTEIYAFNGSVSSNATYKVWVTVNATTNTAQVEDGNATATSGDSTAIVNLTNTTVTGTIDITELGDPINSSEANGSTTGLGTDVELIKGVDVNVSTNITQALVDDTSGNSYVHIRIDYNQSQIDGLGIDENTLYIYKWVSSSSWVKLVKGSPSYCVANGRNTTADYVWVNVTECSILGLGGSAPSDGNGGSTSSGDGGDGTYPPGWFGTPTPTVTATKAPTATPTATAAPPGERVTPAPTKKPEAVKTATPAAAETAKKGAPGFTAVFAIAGMLAVAYLVMRRRG